jgi:hypothetical protein
LILLSPFSCRIDLLPGNWNAAENDFSGQSVARAITVGVDFCMNPAPAAPPLPEGLSVERIGTTTTVSIRWRNMASWALLPLGLVAAAIPVGLFFKLRDLPWNDPIQVLVVVFGIVGLVFSFIVIRRLINVTRLEVTPERIRISHGPVPWRRPSEVATDTIRSVEVRPFQWRYEGNVATHYHVWSLHNDGHETCLLERDTTKEQANLVRDEIQRALDARAAGKPD